MNHDDQQPDCTHRYIGAIMATLEGHTAEIVSLAFNTEGTRMLTGEPSSTRWALPIHLEVYRILYISQVPSTILRDYGTYQQGRVCMWVYHEGSLPTSSTTASYRSSLVTVGRLQPHSLTLQETLL